MLLYIIVGENICVNTHTLTLLHRFMYYIINACMNKLGYFVKILPVSSS